MLISSKVLLLGTAGLGVAGIGIYGIISNFFDKTNHKHWKTFKSLSSTYSFKKFQGGTGNNRVFEIEVMDPNDPWWGKKWEEYKSQTTITQKKEAKNSLEGFQKVCYETINSRGMGLPDAAKYSKDDGTLDKNISGSSHLSDDTFNEDKFIWEMCIKVTLVK